MTDSTGYLVPAGLLGALGALWGGTLTAVSPLRHGAGAPLSDEERATLVGSGVLDPGGALSAGARTALDVLGAADAFTRVYLSGGFAPYEFLVCFGSSGATASLVNTGGDMSIASPALAEEFVGMVGESAGVSSLVGAPFAATLAHDEAVVLGALVDAQRKASLKAIIDGGDPQPVESAPEAVAKSVAKAGEDLQWLANVLLDMLSSGGVASAKVVPALLALESKGLVSKTGGGYRLADACLLLGQRLLALDGVMTLTAGAVSDGGAVSVAGFTCVLAGVHDLLYIESGDDDVVIRSISGAELQEYARAFLADGSVVRKLQSAAGIPDAAPKTAARTVFCTRCGAKLADGAAFCVKCGAKVE